MYVARRQMQCSLGCSRGTAGRWLFELLDQRMKTSLAEDKYQGRICVGPRAGGNDKSCQRQQSCVIIGSKATYCSM